MTNTVPESSALLTSEATSFLQELHRQFSPMRTKALEDRVANLGLRLYPTEAMRVASRNLSLDRWSCRPTPPALRDRRIEITGPAEAKMMINGLNSGARVFMADLEDALSPTWTNILRGHEALQTALRGELTFQSPEGKAYALHSAVATLVVRPRGWHLLEPRFQVDGEAMSASLFDFGLFFFHGAKYGVETDSGPYFYLPKIESPMEAKLWADVFAWSEAHLGIAKGSIAATVLIETLPAALAMEEIVYALKDYLVGLNAGRWDYLFSMIKSIAGTPTELIFPDRSLLTMATPFMQRYASAIVEICHRRGLHAIGGMSAFVPSRKDEAANTRALEQVRIDKSREAKQGFDGTWVAHPDLVPVALACFQSVLGEKIHQKDRETSPHQHAEPVSPLSFLPRASEEPFLSHRPTLKGLQSNVDIALQYLAYWFTGQGAVAIHGLMEDAATAEISRAQLWQWRKNHVRLDNGTFVDSAMLELEIRSIAETLQSQLPNKLILKMNDSSLSIAGSPLEKATELLIALVNQTSFVPFLTLPAMDRLENLNSHLDTEERVASHDKRDHSNSQRKNNPHLYSV